MANPHFIPTVGDLLAALDGVDPAVPVLLHLDPMGPEWTAQLRTTPDGVWISRYGHDFIEEP
jgi:hypothetical protein